MGQGVQAGHERRGERLGARAGACGDAVHRPFPVQLLHQGLPALGEGIRVDEVDLVQHQPALLGCQLGIEGGEFIRQGTDVRGGRSVGIQWGDVHQMEQQPGPTQML